MDIEAQLRQPRYLKGYPSLAAFIASDRDHTSAVFKRFRRLGARDLLHLQSELAELEAQQDALDAREWEGAHTAKQYSRNWPDFCSAAQHDLRQRERKLLAETIHRVLREYRETLFFESHLSTLPQPARSTLRAFRNQFHNEDSISSFPTLGAKSAYLYDDIDDVVVLGNQQERDRLTAFVQDYFAWVFRTEAHDGNIAYTSDRRIARFVAILSTINAAALLIGAIVSLYSVTSSRKKLGIIAGFTTLFTVNVGVLTNARRAELFAASAAYAAVLVVFVSGNLGSGSSGAL